MVRDDLASRQLKRSAAHVRENSRSFYCQFCRRVQTNLVGRRHAKLRESLDDLSTRSKRLLAAGGDLANKLVIS